MKTDGKVLTVIVPAYNMEAYLPACLDSVLVDDPVLKGLDVVVVNDGSADGTGGIAHEYERRFPGFVRAIDKENGHYGSCVNAGVRAARGFFVKILDADDTFDAAAFSRYLGFLGRVASEGGPDAVFNNFVEVDPRGNVLKKHDYAFMDVPGFTLAGFEGQDGPWMHALAYRTEFLRKIGYRQTEGILYTDQEWSTIPLMRTASVVHCPETVYLYLVGRPGQSINPDVKRRNFAMHLAVERSIVEAYEKAKSSVGPDNLVPAKCQIEWHVGWFYRTYLTSVAARSGLDKLVAFDGFLETASPEIYRFADGLTLPSRIFRFKFVREWRRRKSRKSIKFFLMVSWILLLSVLRRAATLLRFRREPLHGLG